MSDGCAPVCERNPRLQVLRHVNWEPGGYAVLTSLPRLERLSLKYNSNLPDCLSLLVTLSELKLNRASIGMPAPAANAAVNAALQQLTQVRKVGSARALLVDKDGNSAG